MYENFTLRQVTSKIKKLRGKYKQEKDKSRKTGNGATKKWKFFDEIDVFLSKRHITPPVVVDTMKEKDKKGEQDEDMLVDNSLRTIVCI